MLQSLYMLCLEKEKERKSLTDSLNEMDYKIVIYNLGLVIQFSRLTMYGCTVDMHWREICVKRIQ